MALPKLKTFVWIGAGLGALGPLFYCLSPAVKDYILGDGWFLWATGPFVIVAYGHNGDLFEAIVVAISVALNCALCAGVAALIWFALAKVTGRDRQAG